MKYTSVPAASSTEFERSPLGSFRKVFFVLYPSRWTPSLFHSLFFRQQYFSSQTLFFFLCSPQFFGAWAGSWVAQLSHKASGYKSQSTAPPCWFPSLFRLFHYESASFFFGSSISNALSIGPTKINGNDMPAGIECTSPPSERLTLS